VNVNRNVHVHRGYHGGGYYDHNDGIGVGGAIAIGVAGMAIGSMITAAALPPSCSTVSVNGITYQQCGSTWYQPQYSGSQVNYIVVNPPR
jgi:methylase of polypeptide subunit release factors